jgi:hypothetical protein
VVKGGLSLGDQGTARPSRRGGKAAERFKRKSKALTGRSHHLEAAVVTQVNRGIRGTGRDCATAVGTCLGQCNERDRGLRRRIRGMKYKRRWQTDYRRLQSRHSRHRSVVRCREVSVRARDGEDTAATPGALAWGPPGVRKTPAGN